VSSTNRNFRLIQDGLLAAVLVGLVLSPLAAQGPARRAKAKDDSLTFEMRSMPWATVFEWLSDRTGLPVISTLKPPKGSLNIISPKQKYSLAQVMDIINSSLLEQKLVLIHGPKAFTLVPSDRKIRPGLVPRVSTRDLDKRGKTEVVSVVLKMGEIPVEDVEKDVQKLQGPAGSLIVLPRANQLIVQDTVDNIENILQTVKDIRENEKGVAETSFEVIKLKRANPTNVAKVLNEVYNGTPANGAQPGMPPFFGGRFGRGGFGGFGGPPAPAANGKKNEPRVRVVADSDTNAILVKATPLDMAAIKKLVREFLDAGNDESEALLHTHVIGPLKHAQATDVAAVIKDVYRESMNNNPTADQQPRRRFFFGNNQTMGIDQNGQAKGVTLSVGTDERTNSLIISCPDRMYKDIQKLVEMLEKAAAKTTQTVKVVSIKGIDPKVIQQALDAIQGRSTTNGNGTMQRQTMIAPIPFGPGFGGGRPGFGGPGGGFGPGQPQRGRGR
jgi:type II secretory pathway component GspD/PulD (secretin)